MSTAADNKLKPGDRYYLHVGRDGSEERFSEQPRDKLTLTVDVMMVSRRTIIEQTYTRDRETNMKCFPPGDGWFEVEPTRDRTSTIWRRERTIMKRAA